MQQQQDDSTPALLRGDDNEAPPREQQHHPREDPQHRKQQPQPQPQPQQPPRGDSGKHQQQQHDAEEEEGEQQIAPPSSFLTPTPISADAVEEAAALQEEDLAGNSNNTSDDDGDKLSDPFPLPEFKDQVRLAGPDAVAAGGANAAAAAAAADKPDPFLPHNKDQVQTSGPDAAVASVPASGGGVAPATATTFIPWAQNVRAISEDNTTYDVNQRHLSTLQLQMPHPAAAVAGSTAEPIMLSANDSDVHSTETPETETPETPAATSVGGGDIQQVVLCKHMMWAGAFIVAVLVIAVSISVPLAVILSGKPSPTAVLSPPTFPPQTSSMTSMPSTTVLPIPDVETTAPPILLPTVAPTTKQTVTLEPFSSNVVPTQIPALLPTAPTVLPVDSQIKLTAPDGSGGDLFGWSVAMHGDTLVIGAKEDGGIGSAYVYTRGSTESVWTEQAKLMASDGAAGDEFGNSVAVDLDTIVIGASRDGTENGSNSGSAYVYTLSGTDWSEQVKLIASDGSALDRFGWSVAVDGDAIVIGAPEYLKANDSGGSAYVYTRSGTFWTEQTKLLASDGAQYDYFGWSVAMSGGTLVIGAAEDDTEKGSASGSAYVYTRRTETVWTEQAKLTASDGASNDYFGYSAAVDGDTFAIGALYDDTESGSVYVYTRISTGTDWTEQAKLTASDDAAGDEFGNSVAIDGDILVIGAWRDQTKNGEDSGSAYVFTRTGAVWTEQANLSASDGAADDNFGWSVALDGGTIVIGAYVDDTEKGEDSGSVYIEYLFEREAE